MKRSYSYRFTQVNQFSASRLGDAMTQGTFEHYLLEGNSCDRCHEHWRYGSLVLDEMWGDYGEWIRGSFRPDRVCIGYFKAAPRAAWINGSLVGENVIQVFAERCELACRLYSQTRWVLIQVPRSCLEQICGLVAGNKVRLRAVKAGGASFFAGGVGGGNVEGCFDLCTHLLGKGGELAERGIEMLLLALAEVVLAGERPESRFSDEGGRGPQALQKVKLAELYLAAHLAESYSSDGFARAVGLSERSLELQFKKIFGMSPKKWRQYMGLNIAHRRLGKAGVKPGVVAEIAASCGFAHPGRFSAFYREVFGETPLQTNKSGETGFSFSHEAQIFKTWMH